ncbi:MAG: hypothetical protein ACE5JO_02310 [Candidatus Binatia bacterium]
MDRLLVFLIILGLSFGPVQAASAQATSAQVPVGRFQLVSVSAGQQAGVFLVDTATGCTWQLGLNQETKRLSFVEMDVENLHWSWGSGAQQILAKKIDQSKLPGEQKSQLKQELNRTACGWTPVVLTPPRPPRKPEAAPRKKE